MNKGAGAAHGKFYDDLKEVLSLRLFNNLEIKSIFSLASMLAFYYVSHSSVMDIRDISKEYARKIQDYLGTRVVSPHDFNSIISLFLVAIGEKSDRQSQTAENMNIIATELLSELHNYDDFETIKSIILPLLGGPSSNNIINLIANNQKGIAKIYTVIASDKKIFSAEYTKTMEDILQILSRRNYILGNIEYIIILMAMIISGAIIAKLCMTWLGALAPVVMIPLMIIIAILAIQIPDIGTLQIFPVFPTHSEKSIKLLIAKIRGNRARAAKAANHQIKTEIEKPLEFARDKKKVVRPKKEHTADTIEAANILKTNVTRQN